MASAHLITKPTREEPGAVPGLAVATEIVPRTRPRGFRTPRREEWEIPAIIPEDLAVLAAIGAGAILLNLSECIVKGIVAWQFGLLPS
jgi:hypothetical protein